jgi:hypothetical protein
MPASEFRLAEPSALSVATDLARGRPPEQALYACIIATRLAGYLYLGEADRDNACFATLLRFAGCTATSHEYALYLGGNDIAVRFRRAGISFTTSMHGTSSGLSYAGLDRSPAAHPRLSRTGP